MCDDQRVEQFTQFRPPEQFGEQCRVERQRGSTTLGERRVSLIHERGDVAEQQRSGERRCLLGLHLDQPDAACFDLPGDADERRQVVHILQNLAHRLENDREARILARDIQQLGRTLALLPQRRSGSRVVARQQKSPRGALAETGREQRRPTDLLGHDVTEFRRVEEEEVEPWRFALGVGDAQDDTVVARHRPTIDAEAVTNSRADRERPRCVHLHAVWGVEHDAPVAQPVTEPLDHQGLVGGDVTGRCPLLLDEGHEVLDRALVEISHARALHGGSACRDLADELADRLAKFHRASQSVATPERHSTWLPERRRDDDAVMRDVLDAPAGRAECEHVAHPRLVDHLLVELADPQRCALTGVHHEHPEQAAVGDGAAGGDRETLSARAAGDPAGHPVPDDARPEFGELIGRVQAAEQVERRVVGGAGKPGERRTAPDGVVPVVDIQRIEGDRRDRLLGEDVERVLRNRKGLDEAGRHPFARHRRVDEVGAMLREDDAARHLAHLVPGAPDALQATGDRWRRLDLNHQVDSAHIDAELEGRGGHDAAQPAGLQVVLDERPLIFRHGAVVRAGEQSGRAGGLAGGADHLGGS